MNALHIGAQLSKSLLLVNLVQSRGHRGASLRHQVMGHGHRATTPSSLFFVGAEISSPISS